MTLLAPATLADGLERLSFPVAVIDEVDSQEDKECDARRRERTFAERPLLVGGS